MSRGPFYSDTEIERLLLLYRNNEDKSLEEIADMAIKLGICENRSINAIAQRISKETRQKVAQIEDDNEQLSFEIIEADIYKSKYEKVAAELDSLLSVLIDEATLYAGAYFNNLKYNYPEITRWLRKNRPERLSARLEELEMEVTNAN